MRHIVDTHLLRSEEGTGEIPAVTGLELVDLLRREPERPYVLAEVERRIKSNRATHLAVRLLSGSPGERDDAFDGLVGLCWKATSPLCIEPTISERSEGKSRYDCTREFIQNFILDYFRAYEAKGEQEILSAAILDKFRYIGRRVFSRMIDEIRRRTAPRNREPWQRPLSANLRSSPSYHRLEEEECRASDGFPGIESVLCGPQHGKGTEYAEFLKPRQGQLTQTLGDAGYEVLLSHFDVHPRAYQGNNQAMESALTRAIQRRRQVSAQQARADKRQFRETIRDKMKTNSELLDLRTRLSRGDDDNTLRVEWVCGNGRKGSFRMRFPLSFS